MFDLICGTHRKEKWGEDLLRNKTVMKMTKKSAKRSELERQEKDRQAVLKYKKMSSM